MKMMNGQFVMQLIVLWISCLFYRVGLWQQWMNIFSFPGSAALKRLSRNVPFVVQILYVHTAKNCFSLLSEQIFINFKVQIKTKTVEDYLNELPDDRQVAIAALREIILDNIPGGYVETINWGAISYEIPLETYPDTYNGKPLSYVALASQKQHMAVYMQTQNN